MPTQSVINGTPSSPQPNGAERHTKSEGSQKQPDGPRQKPEPGISSAKVSGADLKKQKAAEKAARRAEKVAERDAELQPQQDAVPKPSSGSQQAQQSSKPGLRRRPSGSNQDAQTLHKRTGSTTTRPLPIRAGAAPPAFESLKEKPKEIKRVAMFSHLHTRDRRASIAGTAKDVHPAVLVLGLQIRDYVLCGANARCVSMLLVFKKVIDAYNTPPGMALSRHLTQHLSHQIAFLSRSRPLSISQGNSIRWLKKLISALDPDLSDFDAKAFLGESIDSFIRERVMLADELIAKEANARIRGDDNQEVILTYGKSSIVEKALLEAKDQHKNFKVLVVDSRPLFEGKNLALNLTAAGIEVEYCLLSGLSAVVNRATKCFLGASGMTGNGALHSRAGTALVAMMVKTMAKNVPVIVLCETIKFTGKVAMDSIMLNELGDVEMLVETAETESFAKNSSALPPPNTAQKGTGGKKGGGGTKDDEKATNDEKLPIGLEAWKQQQNLHLLNPMYDVTPAEYLDLVITEMGCMPPSSVPVVNGFQGGE